MADPGTLLGTRPNLRWRNPTWEDVRGVSATPTSPTIDPLPFRPRHAPSALADLDPARVRQTDRALTRALHRGILTGGRLLAFLGFRDAPAAARVGLPTPRGPAAGASFLSAAADVALPSWDPSEGLVELPPEDDEPEARARRDDSGLVGPLRRPPAVTLAGSASPASVAMAWGLYHEPAALQALAVALAPAGSMVGEAGLFRVSAAALADLGVDTAATPLPPLGASPDAVVTHVITQTCVDAALVAAGKRDEEGEGGGGAPPPPPPIIRAPGPWTEAVEVKSVSPFAGVRHGPGGRPTLALADPGPRGAGSKVLIRAIPQLQLEMLATGATSALLVSSSATRGARVWRVGRDDAYLRSMLQNVVSPAYVAHCLHDRGGGGGGQQTGPGRRRRRKPTAVPTSTFTHPAGEEAIQRLVTATLRVAARAKEVAVIAPAAGWGCEGGGPTGAAAAFLD